MTTPSPAGLERIPFTGQLGPLVTLPDGRILATYTDHGEDARYGVVNPEMWTYGRYSSDGGRTWSEPVKLHAYPEGEGVGGSFLPLVDRDGSLHAFGTRYFSLGKDGGGYRSMVTHRRSADGGTTWTDVKRVDFGREYTGALNSAIQMDSGRILLPLSYLDESRSHDMFVSVVCYSDDGGDTWRYGNDLPVDSGSEYLESGSIEPVCVQLPNGLVWLLMRTQTGYLWESFSSDGASWTFPRSTRFVASNAPAGLIRLRDDRIALFWNMVYGEPFRRGASFARYRLHGAISDDDGQTFSRAKVIAERNPGEPFETHVRYPFMAEAPDGRILVYYNRILVWPDRERDRSSELVRVDPDWLGS